MDEVDPGGGFRFSPRPNRADEIEWRQWGVPAFEEAEREGKLVLLSISAVWCHWCHVMDETTYSDPEVIEKINSAFVPVRVDSDMRPDLNRRYNQGGWPTTAFLLPSGRAIAGLTYSPPPQLSVLLDRLRSTYRNRKGEIETEAVTLAVDERRLLLSFKGEEVDPGAPGEVMAATLVSWDREYGGLGSEPKFPPAGEVELALARYVETGEREPMEFVVSTLDGMGRGGLNDDVEGGFFRYATTRDWSVPHYEKMLQGNAELIRVYLAASAVLDRPDYADVARTALDYCLVTLMDDEQRGFMGSQDADEKYYELDAGDRSNTMAPAVDRTIYTDSTSSMVSTLVLASAVLLDVGLLRIAERVNDYLWREGFRHGSGICHYFKLPAGSPELWGQPADQVRMLSCLVELYQATEEPRFLERAVELGDLVRERYICDPGWLCESSNGAGREEAATGGSVLDDAPIDMPDIALNGEGARALLALDALVPGKGYGDAAEGILTALSGRYRSYKHFASSYAIAVGMFLRGPIEVRVSVGSDPELRKEIISTAIAAFNPRKVTRPETAMDNFPVDGESELPPAVVCSPGNCLPAYSAAGLLEALDSLAGGEAG